MDYVNTASPYLQGAGALAGLGSSGWNLYNNIMNQNLQRQTANRLADPAALTRYMQGLYQPMSAAETTQVNRGLNANLALRGLPVGGVANQYVADAMAKIESERRLASQQQALAALSGVSKAVPPYQPTNQFGSVLQSLAALQALRKQPQQNSGLAEVPNYSGAPYASDVPLSGFSNPAYDFGDIAL